MGLEIMGRRRRPEQRDGKILCAVPRLVMQPALDAGPYMAADALHFFVRRLDPALVRGLDRMAAGAKFRMVRQRYCRCPQSHRAGDNRSDRNGRRSTRHLGNVGGNAA